MRGWHLWFRVRLTLIELGSGWVLTLAGRGRVDLIFHKNVQDTFSGEKFISTFANSGHRYLREHFFLIPNPYIFVRFYTSILETSEYLTDSTEDSCVFRVVSDLKPKIALEVNTQLEKKGGNELKF